MPFTNAVTAGRRPGMFRIRANAPKPQNTQAPLVGQHSYSQVSIMHVIPSNFVTLE